MTATILDGKQLAAEIRTVLKEKVSKLPSTPHLAVIMVGDNQASSLYVRNKQKASSEIGIDSQLYHFKESTPENEVLELVNQLNINPSINGILVQLPLPRHFNEELVLNAISPLKDVDGFHPYNIGLLQNNSPSAVIAATPKGIMRLLQSTLTDFAGKRALVIGRSKIVGKPVVQLLLGQNCTVTIAHSHTHNLPQLTQEADVVVAACGCPEMIKGEWIKKGAIVIDVGINRVNGKLCGDVEFSGAAEKASFITPVPGGVGPMTIAMLLENTYEAYLKQKNS